MLCSMFLQSVVLLTFLVECVYASVGDLNQDFQLCTAECMANFGCPVRAGFLELFDRRFVTRVFRLLYVDTKALF